MLIHYIGTNLRELRSQSGFEDDNLQTEPVSGSPTRSRVSWFIAFIERKLKKNGVHVKRCLYEIDLPKRFETPDHSG